MPEAMVPSARNHAGDPAFSDDFEDEGGCLHLSHTEQMRGLMGLLHGLQNERHRQETIAPHVWGQLLIMLLIRLKSKRTRSSLEEALPQHAVRLLWQLLLKTPMSEHINRGVLRGADPNGSPSCLPSVRESIDRLFELMYIGEEGDVEYAEGIEEYLTAAFVPMSAHVDEVPLGAGGNQPGSQPVGVQGQALAGNCGSCGSGPGWSPGPEPAACLGQGPGPPVQSLAAWPPPPPSHPGPHAACNWEATSPGPPPPGVPMLPSETAYSGNSLTAFEAMAPQAPGVWQQEPAQVERAPRPPLQAPSALQGPGSWPRDQAPTLPWQPQVPQALDSLGWTAPSREVRPPEVSSHLPMSMPQVRPVPGLDHGRGAHKELEGAAASQHRMVASLLRHCEQRMAAHER